MASTNIYKTFSSSTNNKTCTLSVWVKRSGLNNRQAIASQTVDGSNETFIWFDTNDELFLKESGEATYEYRTNRKFRDASAWYHIVMAIDTTQSTASDRIKLYINGVRETSFASSTAPALNDDTRWNSTTQFNIGRMNYGSNYFNGLMSHLHWIDGTAYDASAFGETDATTGEWKIKTSPSVTYGTNGFFILKDGNSVTDQSGRGNNWQVGNGTLTKTEDCPDNVFATLNPLATSSYNTLTNGNLTVAGNADANDGKTYSTLVMPNATSKFYWEIKCVSKEDNGNPKYGFIQASRGFDNSNGNQAGGSLNPCYDFIIRPSGQIDTNGSTGSVITSTWGAGDILSFALDSINGACYVGINGVWQTSGNPTSGASRTGAILTWSPTQGGSIGALDGQAIYISSYATGSVSNFNFGNGYFGTTAVSSAGTNASGIGIFEYDVPANFTALSTKGLNL